MQSRLPPLAGLPPAQSAVYLQHLALNAHEEVGTWGHGDMGTWGGGGRPSAQGQAGHP